MHMPALPSVRAPRVWHLSGTTSTLACACADLAVYDMEGYSPPTDPMPRPANVTCDTPGGCQVRSVLWLLVRSHAR